ncbi:MAG: hypothetical protein RQ899_03150 [Pseudomonadales bacterium]|nr:hypothetical protein [Pseudomonadales bacterium]
MRFLTGRFITGFFLLALTGLSFANDSETRATLAYAPAPATVDVIALNSEQIEKLKLEREKHQASLDKIKSEHIQAIESILGTRDN